MPDHLFAGKPVPSELIIDPDVLIADYFRLKPNAEDPDEAVSFGTSGHRGSSSDTRFNENHILATTQAICDYRVLNGIDGPLFLGKDTHALSGPATDTALEVLAANGMEVRYQENDGFTPTPVISNANLRYNREGKGGADGIVVTPSHNPPRDGGFKYNPPSGGPADGAITSWV
ncbi:MAG: phosphoglucomutase, alpha-D-glucose phosphate-specific, partial [Bacteroidetes Order II. Incertae sedis bacterium]|nr:phosphoglucomutase, alpha-D-glucose phosphate-specific [Bacteroidetes Order II. bacterium]